MEEAGNRGEINTEIRIKDKTHLNSNKLPLMDILVRKTGGFICLLCEE